MNTKIKNLLVHAEDKKHSVVFKPHPSVPKTLQIVSSVYIMRSVLPVPIPQTVEIELNVVPEQGTQVASGTLAS